MDSPSGCQTISEIREKRVAGGNGGRHLARGQASPGALCGAVTGVGRSMLGAVHHHGTTFAHAAASTTWGAGKCLQR